MSEFRLETQSIKPNVGMDQQAVHQCGDVLSKLFADQWVLCTKALHCKHNVLGKRREMLKDLFKVIHHKFVLATEITGKELRNLGFRVPHLPEMLEITRISPSPKGEKWPDADSMVSMLLEDVERVTQMLYRDTIRFEKQDIKAPDVEDFLEDTLRLHKEIAKKLRCRTYGVRREERHQRQRAWRLREERLRTQQLWRSLLVKKNHVPPANCRPSSFAQKGKG